MNRAADTVYKHRMPITSKRRTGLVCLGALFLTVAAIVGYQLWRPLSATERRLVGDWRAHRGDGKPAFDERYSADRRFFVRVRGDKDFDLTTDSSWSVSGDTVIYRIDFEFTMWWRLFTGALDHGYLRAPGEYGRQRIEFVSDDELYFYPDPDDPTNRLRLLRIEETTPPLE